MSVFADRKADMTLGETQRLFTKLVAQLIVWAYECGYELSLGEAWRTQEQQAIYVKLGRSKTMDSRHCQRLAVDLNLFVDGRYMTKTQDHAPLGSYWKSLHPNCEWGGDWGWDGNHYEMVVK